VSRAGAGQHEAMLERLEQYARLRGEGILPPDAARGVGLTSINSARAYERWYRRLGLPDRPRDGGWSER
jgi:hypothetical protein